MNNFNNDIEVATEVVDDLQDINTRDTNVINMFQEDVSSQDNSYTFKMNTEYGKKVGRSYSNIESEYERRETQLINAKQNKIHIYSTKPDKRFPLIENTLNSRNYKKL